MSDKSGNRPRRPDSALEALEEAWRDVAPPSSRRLVVAAVAAFAEQGFHGTTTRDIASRAGMSPAALYVHFKSKEEILFHIATIGHAQVHDAITAAAADADQPADVLAAVVRSFASWHARHHTTARVVQYELNALNPEHQRSILIARRAIEGDIRAVIARGVETGDFTVPDVAGSALTILSLCVDVARWYQPDGRLDPDEIGQLYAATALRIVGARATDEAVSQKPRPSHKGYPRTDEDSQTRSEC